VFEHSGVPQSLYPKEESLALVRGANAASWEYGKPDGVTFSFQVNL
jgi:hypothetical protein